MTDVFKGVGGWAKGEEPQGAQGAQGEFVSHDERAAAGGEVLYGVQKDNADKAASKYDPALEAALRGWIQQKAGVAFGEGTSLQEELKSGVVLCQLANSIKPGCCKNPSTMSQPFKQMENIGSYLAACTSLGITGPQQFQTIDLYENKDMNSVLMNLNALKTLSP